MMTSKFNNLSMGSSLNSQCSPTIAQLPSDGAKKYEAIVLDFRERKIRKSSFPPYTPELNAIGERINRTMTEAAQFLLIQAHLSKRRRPFALKHAIYVRNRVWHSTVGDTSFSVLMSRKTSLRHVRVFGCTTFLLRLPRLSKFDARPVERVYLETPKHGVCRIRIR